MTTRPEPTDEDKNTYEAVYDLQPEWHEADPAAPAPLLISDIADLKPGATPEAGSLSDDDHLYNHLYPNG